MDILDAIFYRTSYRGSYLPTPVPEAHLRTILEAGVAAPSGCNRQTASFIAVDDPALLERIRAAIAPCQGETAPALICVLTKPAEGNVRSYQKQDYAAAIENMLLACVALGYESCWVEGRITEADRLGRRIADVLGVPQEYDLVCYLPIGKAAEPLSHVKKRPFAARASFNGFQTER